MKPIAKFIWTVLIMGFLWQHFFGKANGGSDLSQLVKQGALVVDVRSTGEYATGHIAGAINIPHSMVAREIGHHASARGNPIILYCLSGGRSAAAKKSLHQAGYTNVVNAGGLQEIRQELEP